MSLGSGRSGAWSSKAHPPHVSPLFAAGHQARYPAGYTASIRLEDRRVRSRFPVAFRRPAFASWASCSRQGIRLSSRSACRPAPRRRPPDPDGVSTFHTHEIRPDRVSSLPRGRRCSYDHRCVRGRRLPPHNGRPLPPRYNQPTRDVRLTRHQQGFSVIHPFGLPLAGDTRSGRAPLGFPLSFAPSRCRPRTSGRGQVWNPDPSHIFGVTPNLQSTNLLITCDIVSQHTLMPQVGSAGVGERHLPGTGGRKAGGCGDPASDDADSVEGEGGRSRRPTRGETVVARGGGKLGYGSTVTPPHSSGATSRIV